MTKHICLAAILVLILASSECLADEYRHWRLGASYARFFSIDTRSLLGDAWEIGGEYSFSDALTSDDNIPGDVSLAASYRRFDHDYRGINFIANYTSFGLKWRGGPGANAGFNGPYGGVGVAVAFVNTRPSVDVLSPSESQIKFQWSVLGGYNFGDHYYSEITYAAIPNIGQFDFAILTVTVGIRF